MNRMTRLRAHAACVIVSVCGLFATAASASETTPGIERFLDADGRLSLPAEFSGSVDPSGFRLVSGDGEAPRFAALDKSLADTDARWAEGFGLAGCGTLNAMAIGPDGEIYFGGHFSSCGGVAANHVVRYEPATDTWSPLGSGEGNGVGSSSIGGTVSALAMFDGDLYVGGDFNIANIGDDVRANNIARWDGSTWTAVASASGSNYGAGTNGPVETLAVWNGSLYVGGFFREANSGGGGFPWTVTASRIARWDGSTWHALGGGAGDSGSNGWVRALIAHGGALYVGGSFHVVDGSLPVRNLARWDGSAWSAVGSGAGNGVSSDSGTYDLFGGVWAMAEWNGDLYVAGNFSRANFGEHVAANNIARWDGSAWHSLSGTSVNGTVGRIEALAAAPDGLYVGGQITSVIGASVQQANRVARWDGSNWSVLGTAANNGVDDNVQSLLAHDGGVYVGGYFDATREPVPQRTRGLLRWQGSWTIPGGGAGLGIEGEVRAIAAYRGDIYVGGYITMAGGLPVNRIARWNGNQWSTVGSGGGNGVGINNAPLAGAVLALHVHDDMLYIGGGFNVLNVGGTQVTASNFARWDGSTWASIGNGANIGVRAITTHDGDLYIGGDFNTVNFAATNSAERVAASRVARWNGSTWSALGSGSGNGVFGNVNFTGQVYALASFQGDLYVGGAFDVANYDAAMPSAALAAKGIARWNGSQWSALTTPTGQGVYGDTNAMAVAHGRLYIAGNFGGVNGAANLMPAGRIAAWNGSSWEFVGSNGGNGVNDHIHALAAHDDQLYVGGMFYEANNTPPLGDVRANYIARWDGVQWTRLGRGIARGQFRFVYALAATDADTLWVGGNFGAAGSHGAENITYYGTRGRVDVSTSGAGNGRVTGPGGIDCPGTCSALLPWDVPVELVAEPAIDSELAAWSGDCSGDGACVLAFDRDATVDAQFDIRTFTLAYSAGANGSLDGEVAQIVAYGDDGSAVTAVPAVGHHFDRWSDGVGANPRTDATVTADLAVTALFEINRYDVTASAIGNGGVSPLLQSIAHGSAATITLAPDAHHHVANVTGDTCTPLDNSDGTWTASAIVAPCHVVATFAIDSYVVSASVAGNGSITPASQTIDHGGNAVFAVAADAHHHLVAVTGDSCTPTDAGNGQWTVANVSAACAVVATFAIDTYAVTAAAVGEGDITPATQSVDHGAAAIFLVTAAANHHLVSVTGDSCTPSELGDDQWTATNITAACHVVATFAIDTYAVTASADGEGSITPASQTVDHGADAAFVVTPAENHHVVSVSGDSCSPVDNGDGNWTAAEIGGACHVVATFAIDTYAVTVSIDGSGALNPAPGTPFALTAVPHGSSVTFEAVPDAGHRIVSIAGCGASIDDAAGFTTAAIVADCSVVATFNRNPVALDGSLVLAEDAAATPGQLVADDDDSTLTFELLDSGTRGTAVLLDAATGAFAYTPHADEFGSDTLQFRVGDGDAESNVANIAVEITPVNDAPSLSLAGDISHAAGSDGAHAVPAFAQFVAGPANESAQQVDAYVIAQIDDAAGVLVVGSVGVDVSGELSYTLTGTGGEATVELRVRDDGGTAAGGVDLSEPASFTLTVAPSADLQVQKDDGRNGVRSGETLIYTITVANAGPNDAYGVVLEDLPPAQLNDVAWACTAGGAGAACPPPPHDAGTGALSSTVDLPAGGHLRFELSAIVDGATGAEIVNTARVTAPAGLVDPHPGNETSTDTTRIVPDGIFGDGFEPLGTGLTLPAAKQAHARDVRDRNTP